jgi:chitinase
VYNKTSEVLISYDNAQSFQAKGKYIKQNKLAGFAVWEAAGDYDDILLDAIREGAGMC